MDFTYKYSYVVRIILINLYYFEVYSFNEDCQVFRLNEQ